VEQQSLGCLPPDAISRVWVIGGQLWACASYGLVSVSLTITQKTVFHHFSFPYPNCVTLLQILTSIVLMHGLRAGGIIQFDALSRQNVKTVRTVRPLPAGTASVAALNAATPTARFPP
jgi:hypothetical protein